MEDDIFIFIFLTETINIRKLHPIGFHVEQVTSQCLTRRNGHHFTDNNFKCIFIDDKFCISIQISLRFVPKGPINDKAALVQVMAWH